MLYKPHHAGQSLFWPHMLFNCTPLNTARVELKPPLLEEPALSFS